MLRHKPVEGAEQGLGLFGAAFGLRQRPAGGLQGRGLARLVRAEVRQVLSSDYVQVSRLLGRSGWQVAAKHVLPHVLPQALVGAVLLFPHAILHEAGMTSLGFGLEPHLPATGVLLSESMRYVSAGWWWLGVLPGLCLRRCARSCRMGRW